MRVRLAWNDDSAAIRRIHEAAFPTTAEADLVDALDRDGDAVVSLVAEVDRAIVGHVLLSRMQVEADGRPVRALGLAPVAVLPGQQNGGIGGQLVRSAIDEARAGGVELLFLLGEPDYYSRFGFEAGTAAPFASPYAGPYFMALALVDDWQLPKRGVADYAPAFAKLA